jgi:hypothetical protein
VRRIERDLRRKTVAKIGKPLQQTPIGLGVGFGNLKPWNTRARIGQRQAAGQPEFFRAQVDGDDAQGAFDFLDDHPRRLIPL